MSNLLRACLYNQDSHACEDLRKMIGELRLVRVVSEPDTPDALASEIQQSNINIVFFHLDPDSASVCEVIEHVSTSSPELALIAMSKDSTPQAILAPMRAGCDQFVCMPVDPDDLAAAVARVASKRLATERKSRCICVTGASGGVGTTSIASNLALELGSLTGQPCALVDMDFQFGDLAVNFDCSPQFTFFDLANAGASLDESILLRSLMEVPGNVSLLARPSEIQQSETIGPDTVHRVVELLSKCFANVVIDVPTGICARNLAAFSQADRILIVCQLLVPAIRNTKRLYDALIQEGVRESYVGVVVNRGDSSGGRVTMKDIEDILKKPVFASIPNDYEFVARSLDFGQPIAAVEKQNPVRSAIREIAERVLGDDDQSAVKAESRKGFFGRLLAK